MDFVLTTEHVKAMLKGNKDAVDWHYPMVKIFDRFGIDTPERIAMFVAQCGHESANFTVLEENLNYGKEGLARVFKKYFKFVIDGKPATGRDAADYHRQPEKIANVVYADRMGNGDEASGDGWKFRGRGAIQLTGRENYTKFGQHPDVGRTPDEVIGYLEQKQGALASACWFWNTRDLNTWADKGDIVKVTKLINGGKNGLEDRTKHYKANLAILNGDAVETRKALAIVNTSMREGDRGDQVWKMQLALMAACEGNDVHVGDPDTAFVADGSWGPITTLWVKAYQKEMGLTVDGIIGQVTMKSLGMF
tara:strand:- start:167 stop:1087 length:921 start_codon:yes stop_codon:yes gene_type:complete